MTSTATATATVAPEIEAAIQRNLDLVHRFLLGVMEDPSRFEAVPDGASIVLLPDDDPASLDANLAMAAELARNGRNVYLRHIRLSELPEPGPATGANPGDRHVTYDGKGKVRANLVYGADGAWHPTEALPPSL